MASERRLAVYENLRSELPTFERNSRVLSFYMKDGISFRKWMDQRSRTPAYEMVTPTSPDRWSARPTWASVYCSFRSYCKPLATVLILPASDYQHIRCWAYRRDFFYSGCRNYLSQNLSPSIHSWPRSLQWSSLDLCCLSPCCLSPQYNMNTDDVSSLPQFDLSYYRYFAPIVDVDVSLERDRVAWLLLSDSKGRLTLAHLLESSRLLDMSVNRGGAWSQ